MTAAQRSPKSSDVSVGDALPDFELHLTSTMIVAGAIASRDFMPAHHDPEYAKGQGAPDLFVNIMTTNGYVSRFVTDWAGPEALLRKIDIRLGAPNYPGDCMTMSGGVTAKRTEGGEGLVDVGLRGYNRLGDHVTGTITLALPTSEGGASR